MGGPNTNTFEGLVTAPHTPFRDDCGVGGALDLDVVPALARHFAADGVSAVFVAGATGESASLGFDEKCALIQAWAEFGPAAGLRVIAQVGGENVREAVRLAELASSLDGVEALGAIAPTFYKPVSAEMVARSLAPIAKAAGDTPLYYYDIPALTGLRFSARELADAFGKHVPSLRGIKCSRYEGVHVLDYLRAHGGRYDVLCGTDEALLSALVLGVRGAVGSMYNYAAPLFLALIEAYDAGDLERARELQARTIELVQVVSSFGYFGAARAVMERLGVPIGPPRLPIAALSSEARGHLYAALDRIEFDAYTRMGATA